MTLIKMVAPNPTLKGHKLLVLVEPLGAPTDEIFARYKKEFPELEIAYHPTGWGVKYTPEQFPEEEWKNVTVLLTGTTLPSALELAPKIQYVQLSSAGANAILDDPLFKGTKIDFCTASGVHGPQISEWVIGTFLAHQHSLPYYLDLQRQAKWARAGRMNVHDSYQQRVGILGYGNIGRQVARVAIAMGMDVHAYTLHAKNTPESRRDNGWFPPGTGDPEGVFPSKWFSGESTAELHEFLGSGLDLLLIALPLTDKTRGMIGKAEFEVLSANKTFLSNIGRGPIVDTDALMEALNGEVIRGAALDVTDPEPLPDGHPLWSAKNVIITPHVSGQSTRYFERVFSILEYNLKRLSEGKELVNRVSRREGY